MTGLRLCKELRWDTVIPPSSDVYVIKDNVFHVNKCWLFDAYADVYSIDSVIERLSAQLEKSAIKIEYDSGLKKQLASVAYTLKARHTAKKGGRAQGRLKSLWKKSYVPWPVTVKLDNNALHSELAKERENKEKETAALQAKVAALEKVLSEQNAELSELAAKKHSLQKQLEASTRRKRQHEGGYSGSHLRRVRRKLTEKASEYGLDMASPSTSEDAGMSPLAANRIMDECNVSLRTMRKVCQASPNGPSGYAISKLRKE